MPTKQSQQNAGAAMTSVSPPHRILGMVGLIASEDPNLTQHLLTHHNIQATVTSYGPKNLREKAAVLLHRLQQGTDVAFVSDCGSPLIADPGHLLVAAAHTHGIPVVPVPGPSAIIAALTAAGFPCDSFYFLGHLPSASSRVTQHLIDSLRREGPTVTFCTGTEVARIVKSLGDSAPQCSVAVAYDLTKPNEHIIRGTASEVCRRLDPPQGGDVTLIVAGKEGTEQDDRDVRRAQSLSSRRIKIR
jgi:16S rRNA (cytidine1402-2'-O)-methyltransferase